MDFPAPEFSLVLETWTWQYEPVEALIKIWDLFISCAALASISTGREEGRSWLKKCQCLAQRQQLASYHEILKLGRLRSSSSFGHVKTPACLSVTVLVPGWDPGRDLRAQRGLPTSQVGWAADRRCCPRALKHRHQASWLSWERMRPWRWWSGRASRGAGWRRRSPDRSRDVGQGPGLAAAVAAPHERQCHTNSSATQTSRPGSLVKVSPRHQTPHRLHICPNQLLKQTKAPGIC